MLATLTIATCSMLYCIIILNKFYTLKILILLDVAFSRIFAGIRQQSQSLCKDGWRNFDDRADLVKFD